MFLQIRDEFHLYPQINTIFEVFTRCTCFCLFQNRNDLGTPKTRSNVTAVLMPQAALREHLIANLGVSAQELEPVRRPFGGSSRGRSDVDGFGGGGNEGADEGDEGEEEDGQQVSSSSDTIASHTGQAFVPQDRIPHDMWRLCVKWCLYICGTYCGFGHRGEGSRRAWHVRTTICAYTCQCRGFLHRRRYLASAA